MYPGIIGGHCVIPNLDLIENETLDMIKKINTKFDTKLSSKRKNRKK